MELPNRSNVAMDLGSERSRKPDK